MSTLSELIRDVLGCANEVDRLVNCPSPVRPDRIANAQSDLDLAEGTLIDFIFDAVAEKAKQ